MYRKHFEPVSFTSKKDNMEDFFKKNIQCDGKKYLLCKEKNINLLYFTNIPITKYHLFDNILYNGIYTKDNFFTDITELISKIKEG